MGIKITNVNNWENRMVFSPNMASFLENRFPVFDVTISAGNTNVIVSANVSNVLRVSMQTLSGNVIIDGVNFSINDNAGVFVFASGTSDAFTFTQVNQIHQVEVSGNTYQIIWKGSLV